MTSREYWLKREAEQRRRNITDEEQYRRELQRIYKDTLDSVQRDIDSFYARYASKEEITLAEAKRRVTKLDMEAYERKAAKYVRERDFSDKANEEMRLYNLTMKVNRLEMLKSEIGLELVNGFGEMEEFMDSKLNDRVLAEQERLAGILGKTVKGGAKRAEALVNASFWNATFSERLWNHQDELKQEIAKQLQSGLIQGKGSRELARSLRKSFDVSQTAAETLMVTELRRVQTAAAQQSYERNGNEEYEFMTTNDRPCEVCRGLNGKVFKVKDMQPGVNAPPMHPRCHCCTAPHWDEDEYRKWLSEQANSTSMAGRKDKNSTAWNVSRNPISMKQFEELHALASDKKINLMGFEHYDGDPVLLREAITDIGRVLQDYPEIVGGRKRITLRHSYAMDDDVYASVQNQTITINSNAFNNLEELKKDYAERAASGWFVRGTNYRAIMYHEMGHVITNAKKIPQKSLWEEFDVLEIADKLSEYAAQTKKETIAEAMSAYYSNANNNFALKILRYCGIL